MAGPWEEYQPAAERPPWEEYGAAPLAAPPRATGLQSAMSREQLIAQIPGNGSAQPAPTERAPEPSVHEKVLGLVEAGVTAFRSAVNGIGGAAGGVALGLGEDIGRVAQGQRPDLQNLERRVQQGVELVSNPMGLQQRQLSPAGQEYTETVTRGLQQLPAYMPAVGPAQAAAPYARGMRAATADAVQPARQGLAGAMERIGTVADRVLQRQPEQAAGTKPAAGAAGTDMATQRRERAANLPVPIKLTKGQAERTFEQQRFERETAKDPETGKPLRDRYAEQNQRLRENLDALVELTGAEVPHDAELSGSRVVQALAEKAAKAKEKVSAAYRAADEAGETTETVSTERLVRKLEEVEPSATNAGVIKTAEQELVRLGGATRDADGRLVPGELSLKSMEELRKMIGVGGRKDATNAHFAGEIKGAIDAATEGAGGDLYKGARQLYRDYAAEFKNRKIVTDLLEHKRGTEDRKVALEDVRQRVVGKGSLEELSQLRRMLLEAGEPGRQAWRELQGQSMARIRDGALKNVARDERGNPVVSAAELNTRIDELDKDGKLELLFGKQGAQHLRDINDIAKDVLTAPPGAVNTSNTASVLLSALDLSLSAGLGVPAPAATALKTLRNSVKARKLRKQVGEALDGDEIPRRADLDLSARPFDAPEPPAAAAATAQTPEPRKPAPSAAEVRPSKDDPRLVEIERLRAEASPEALRVLDEQEAKVTREIRAALAAERRDIEATRIEATAAKTIDPDLKAALIRRANELRSEKVPAGEATELETTPTPPAGRTPRIPVGEARELPPESGRGPDLKPLPVGRVIEGQPPLDGGAAAARPIPTGEAVELPPEVAVEVIRAQAEEAKRWAQVHRIGTLEAERGIRLAQAELIDPEAVAQAVRQHDNSPRAFDREIERILAEGDRRANEGQQAPADRPGLQPPDGGGEGAGAAVEGQPGSDGAAASRTERGAADPSGRQAEEDRSLSAARAAFERATEPVGNDVTDALSRRLRLDFSGARYDYERLPDSGGGRILNTDVARELSPDYRADRTRSADVHEPASAFIKRLYAKKLSEPTPEGMDREVLFTAGGTGAGKTTGVRQLEARGIKPEIVFDTNMNTLASAEQKIEQALAADRAVSIVYVYADPAQAFHQAMARAARMERKFGSGRTVPIEEHVKTHVGAAAVVRALAERYKGDPRVSIVALDNSRGPGGVRVVDIADLPLVRENGLHGQLEEALHAAHRSGLVSDAVRAGFLARSAHRRQEVGRGVLPGPERGGAEGSGRGSGSEGPQSGLARLPAARDEPGDSSTPRKHDRPAPAPAEG